jgi:hypothetical protein
VTRVTQTAKAFAGLVFFTYALPILFLANSLLADCPTIGSGSCGKII